MRFNPITGQFELGGGAAFNGGTISKNGAANTSQLLFTGSIYTGGTGTSTLPAILQQPTGTTAATNYNTGGTFWGANAPSGFVGDYFNFKLNGGSTSKAKLDYQGNMTLNGWSRADGDGFLATLSGNIYAALNGYNLRMHPDIPVVWGSTAYGASLDAGVNRESAKTVAIMGSGTLTKSGGAYGNIKACYFLPGATLQANMTEGFINLAGAAGAPTGVPNVLTGYPSYWDATNLQHCIYSGGAWKKSAAYT